MFREGCGLTVMNMSQCSHFHNNVSMVPIRFSSISLERLVEYYLIGLICIVGAFGNVVTIVVLRRDKDRQTALLLLQALAVADGLYLLVAVLRYPLKYILPVYRTYILMQPVVFPMLKTCQTITIWIMVLVTIDRYIYLCKPLQAPILFDKRSKQGAAVCVFILGTLYNLPRYFDSCIVEWFNPCTNTTLSRSVTTPMFHHPLYYDIYQQGAYMVMLYIIPLVLLSYLNARLVQTIYKSSQFRRNCTTSSEFSENNTTLTLIIIILVFIVCETPELFLRLATVAERKGNSTMFTPEFSKGLFRLNITSQLLMVINSSINFYIYLIFGRAFRSVMKETFTFRFSTRVNNLAQDTVPLQRTQFIHAPSYPVRQKQVTHVESTYLMTNQVKCSR